MISAELLQAVDAAVSAASRQSAGWDGAVRAQFPGLMLSVCNDNDIPSRIKPLLSREVYALYGVNTSGHCATLVNDADAAEGLTIALIDDDE